MVYGTGRWADMVVLVSVVTGAYGNMVAHWEGLGTCQDHCVLMPTMLPDAHLGHGQFLLHDCVSPC